MAMMREYSVDDGTCSYCAREAVGVFSDSAALELAFDELEVEGFDRATISVVASNNKVKQRLGHLYGNVAEIQDDPRAPQTAVVSTDSLIEGEAAAMGAPVYIGGTAGAFAIVASGGTLAAAIVAAIGGGLAGAVVGILLAMAVGKRHKDHVLGQLAQGGIILWVSLRDAEAENRAKEILTKAGAHDVHIHEIERTWTLKDRPFADIQPDPFLERET